MNKGEGTEKQYYVKNPYGNVVQLTDESGKVIKTYEYDSFVFYNVDIDIKIPDDLDYGFYSVMDRMYVDEYKNPIERGPEIVGIYGLSTNSGIAYQINYELITSGII